MQSDQPSTDQAILPANLPVDADAAGVVPNPSASEPANIPEPSVDAIERMRRKMAAETMEMQDRFNGGLIGRQEGGV